MSKMFHMNGLQAYKVIICHLIFLLALLKGARAGILIYDGNLGIEEFRDVELSNTEPISKDGIKGAIVAASPIDACTNISGPPNVNFTMNWFVLIAGNSCSFEVKVLNARYAGYAVAVLYISETRIPHFIRTKHGYYSFFPNISAVVIGSDQGRIIRDNYLYTISQRYKVYIFPNNSFSIMTFLLLFSIVTGLFLVVMLVFAVIRFFQHSSSCQRGRLSSRHLKQLQTSTYSKGDGSDSCAICLEEYKDQDKLRFLPCSHGYHARCIDPWLTNNRPICPVCKQKVVLEGHNASNTGDSDFDERSETTPLLPSDRRSTQHGTFNLIYNPAGENVGDLNLPSTSSENVGHTQVLRQSVSSSDGRDSSNNLVTENLSGNNLPIDSAPENIGVIKRLVFLKNSSPKKRGSFDISNSSTSDNAIASPDLVAADLTDIDLPVDSAVINIIDADLSSNSAVGIGLASNAASANISDEVISSSSSVTENFPGRNLSSDSAIVNVGSTDLHGDDTITGYVAGMNLSEFWPSDHLNKIKLSKDSLSKNQDGLNLSSDVSVKHGDTNLSSDINVNLGGINFSSDANLSLGGGNVSSESVATEDINLPSESMSVNLHGINLPSESVVANVGDISVSTDSIVANLGNITAPSDSIAANLRSVNVSSDLNRTDLGGIIGAIESAATNLKALNAPRSFVVTNVGISVSDEVDPINLGIHLPGESVAANLDGSNLESGVSISTNLEGINVSSPSISENLGGVNVSSPSISTDLGGISVSSPSISANLGGVNVSSPSISANLGGVNVSSSSVIANLEGVNVSRPQIAVSQSGISVSSPPVDSNLRGNVSRDAAPTNLGINLSSGSAAAARSDASLSKNKPVAANRRRRRK